MSTPGSDVDRWLPAAQAGSKDALEKMLKACWDYLLFIANQELDADLRRKVGASDLVQQTMMEACKDIARFQGGEKELLAWLRQILRHNLDNFVRGQKKTIKRGGAVEIPLPEGGTSSFWPEPPCNDPTPSDPVKETEQKEAVARALKRLPEHYRKVIELKYREGLSFEEISRVMGLSANAVQKLEKRAIERMKLEMNLKLEMNRSNPHEH